MKQAKLFFSFYLSSILLFILVPLSAKGQIIRENAEPTAPITSPEEDFLPSLVLITGVEIKKTDKGIDLILKTAENKTLETNITTEDNSLIIDIANAQLQLPEAEDFRQENPSQDIASVSVINLDSNNVRVTVTGIEGTPIGEIIETSKGFIVSLTPPEPTLEIVVTAEKQPENAQNVPISLTVLTEAEIQDADITSLNDIAGNVPNFTTFTPNRNFIVYSLRGLSNFNFLSRDPVAFYVDDVPYDYTGFLDLDLPDIERVEVLRGPQATLYGRNAQAGAVNIITRKPTNVLEFIGSVSYANFDNPDIRASVSAPIIEDKLAFRFSGSYQARDGYIENTFTNNDIDFQSGGTGRGQLLWTPTEDWEILANLSIDDYRGGISFNTLGSDPSTVVQDFDGFNDLTSNTQSLRVAYSHPNFRFTSITAHRYSDQEFQGDSDITIADILVQVVDVDSSVISQEIRFQSPETAQTFEWLLGGYFESRDFNIGSEGFRFGADSAILGFNRGSNVVTGEINDTTLAVFAQASYRPIEALTLTAGLRYESFNSTLDNRERLFIPADGSPAFSSGQFSDIENSSDILLPRFILEYRFTPDIMAYGSITRGYKPPGVNYRADFPELLTYEAERSWNYEIGLKSAWLDNRLFVNLAFFHNPIADYQVPVPDFTGFFRDVANAQVSITGGELEVRATPHPGLDIIAGLGIVDAHFTDYTNPITGQNFNGNTLSYAPDVTYNLAVQYRSLGGIFARVELQGVGTTFFDDANVFQQGAFALLNARLGYEFDYYGIYFFANNITNVRNLITAADFPPFGTIVSQGAPTTYGIQFRKRF